MYLPLEKNVGEGHFPILMMLPSEQNLILTGQMFYNKTHTSGCIQNTSHLLSQIKGTNILPRQISY
jgi:hypothetical protein